MRGWGGGVAGQGEGSGTCPCMLGAHAEGLAHALTHTASMRRVESLKLERPSRRKDARQTCQSAKQLCKISTETRTLLPTRRSTRARAHTHSLLHAGRSCMRQADVRLARARMPDPRAYNGCLRTRARAESDQLPSLPLGFLSSFLSPSRCPADTTTADPLRSEAMGGKSRGQFRTVVGHLGR